jgi:hypothetical protein
VIAWSVSLGIRGAALDAEPGNRRATYKVIAQFLADWLNGDPSRLGASLEDFVGHPAYNTCQLREDLDRFIFLLGGSDGESLFAPVTKVAWLNHATVAPPVVGVPVLCAQVTRAVTRVSTS